jgi:hypothetical protein
VSVFRLVLTCLWAVSLGIFLVFLEAERVRMQHELLKWSRLREQAVELQARAVFEYWLAFQEAVPGGGLLEHLNREKEKEKEQALSWVSQ